MKPRFDGFLRRPRCAAAAVPLLAAALACCGCGRDAAPSPVERHFPVMGTYATIMTARHEAGRLNEYVAAAGERLAGLEAAMSVYRADSDISRMNREAGGAFVSVQPATLRVLELARRYGDVSAGAFDVTVGPLMRVWGFRGGSPGEAMPSEEDIDRARATVGYRHLELSNGLARLNAAGMQLDLGGIAKGYAVDACVSELLGRGARDFLVNLGGNMRASGEARPRTPWRIGVRHPFEPGAILGSLSLPDGRAVATSGHYERFVTIGGRRYAHIMDPRAGRPVEGMASVTVIADSAADCDALSTALFVLGLEAASELLAQQPGVEAMLVPDRQPIEAWVTPGIAAAFLPLAEIRLRELPPSPALRPGAISEP